ncbi:unnamed protein product, partial [Protopolystoma xenopodis]
IHARHCNLSPSFIYTCVSKSAPSLSSTHIWTHADAQLNAPVVSLQLPPTSVTDSSLVLGAFNWPISAPHPRQATSPLVEPTRDGGKGEPEPSCLHKNHYRHGIDPHYDHRRHHHRKRRHIHNHTYHINLGNYPCPDSRPAPVTHPIADLDNDHQRDHDHHAQLIKSRHNQNHNHHHHHQHHHNHYQKQRLDQPRQLQEEFSGHKTGRSCSRLTEGSLEASHPMGPDIKQTQDVTNSPDISAPIKYPEVTSKRRYSSASGSLIYSSLFLISRLQFFVHRIC